MRNVHGICPECHNRISIDLDAAVVECPICHRRLKAKKPPKPAIPEESIPATEVATPTVPEEVAAQAAETPAAVNDTPVEETPAETVATEEASIPEEIAAPEETPSEEAIPEEPAPEDEPAPAEEPVPEEDAMTEEEAMALAASMDEDTIAPLDTPASEETAEEAPAEEPETPAEEIDADEISAEELALMDDVPPQAVAEPSDETIVYASISDEEEKPEPDEDEEEAEAPEEEESLGEGLKELSADGEEGGLAVEDAEAPAPEEEDDSEFAIGNNEPPVEEAPAEEPAAEEETPSAEEDAPAVEELPATEEAAPAEEADQALAEEPVAEEAAAVEGPEEVAPAEEEIEAPAPQEETVAEEVTAEEPAARETPAEEPEAPLQVEEPAPETEAAPVEAEETPAETEGAAYSDEDFAAAGEIDVRTANTRTFHAPKNPPVVVRTASSTPADKSTAQADSAVPKPASPADHNHIYAKPIAIILAILSLVFVLFELTYGLFVRDAGYASIFLAGNTEGNVYTDAPALLAALPANIITLILGFLPVFGGDKFALIITAVYYGLIAIIAILGITGKKGKTGSILLLIGAIIIGLLRLWALNGNAFFFIPYEGLPELLGTYGSYALCGGYGLIVLAAVFYLVALCAGRKTYSFSFLPGLAAMIFAVLVFLGCAAICVGPVFLAEFPDISAYFNYGLLAIFGITVLLTLIGVHRADLSRSANGYLAAFMLLFFGLLSVIEVILPTLFPELALSEFYTYLLRMMKVSGVMTAALPIGAIGFAFADLRN